MKKFIIFFALLFANPALAAVNLTLGLENSSTQIEQGADGNLVLTITVGGGSDPFPLGNLCNSGFYITGFSGTEFTLSYADRSTYCGNVSQITAGNSQDIPLATINQIDGQTPTTSYNFILSGASIQGVASISIPNKRLILAVVSPSDSVDTVLSGMYPYVPNAGSWNEIANTEYMLWTDGCDGTPNDNSSTPCVGSGGLIRTTDAEADAIDPAIRSGGSRTSRDVMTHWNGAARDRINWQIFLFGGGHNAYYGNEILQLSFTDPSGPRLKRLMDPSPLGIVIGLNTAHPNEGAAAVHQNAAPFFDPTRNEWGTIAGGSADCNQAGGSGCKENTIPAFFDLETLTWSTPISYDTWGTRPDSNISCYHYKTHKVYYIRGQVDLGDIYEIDMDTKTRITKLSDAVGWQIPSSCVSHGDYIYWMGSSNNTNRMHRYNPETNVHETIGGVPPSAASGSAQCLALDAANNDIFIWKGTATMAFFDIDTNTYSTHTPTGSVPTLSGEANGGNGVYSKCIFLEPIHTFVGYANPNEGIWLYRRPGDTWSPSNALTASFESYCANDPNVIRCNSFETAGEFTEWNGVSSGGPVFPVTNPGPSQGNKPFQDQTQVVFGSNSVRFTIPALSGADTAGAWATNFTPDSLSNAQSSSYPDQFGPGQRFFVGFSQYMSSNYLANISNGDGFKTVIIGEGDRAGSADVHSATDLEVVIADLDQRNIPQMYYHRPTIIPLRTSVPPSNFDLQPTDTTAPDWNCLYNGAAGPFTEEAGCAEFPLSEWVEWRIEIKVASSYNGPADGIIRMWLKRAGQPPRLVIEKEGWAFTGVANPSNMKYGQVWLTPYHTGRSSGVSHPVQDTWYDGLVVSKAPIPWFY